jgi:hypothetical protein
MKEDSIKAFGKIERIIDKEFINGQLSYTRFEMKIFSERLEKFIDSSKYFYFYGEIPLGFIGQEARYFRAIDENKDLSQIRADIEIGKITRASVGKYYIQQNNDLNSSVPWTIKSQLIKSIRGHVIFPYAYLDR